jgi:hypothetical protein
MPNHRRQHFANFRHEVYCIPIRKFLHAALTCLCMFLFLSVSCSKHRESNLFPLSFSSLFIFYNREDLLYSSEGSDGDPVHGDKNYLLCIYGLISNILYKVTVSHNYMTKTWVNTLFFRSSCTHIFRKILFIFDIILTTIFAPFPLINRVKISQSPRSDLTGG